MKPILRDRVVVFRLSQQEYQSLKRACDSRGARNVSDFTRSEVLAAIPASPVGGSVDVQMTYLQQQILSLQKATTQLIQLLETVLGPEKAALFSPADNARSMKA